MPRQKSTAKKRKKGRTTKLRADGFPTWWDGFFAALRDSGTITAACQAVEINRTTPYEWLKLHPERKELWEGLVHEAMEEATEKMEIEARRRAVEGFLEPVFYQGVEVGLVRKHSDSLLMFLLKGNSPEKYRERFDHQVGGPGGKPIRFTLKLGEDDAAGA